MRSSLGDYLFPSTESEAQRLERQGALLYGGTGFLEPFLSDELTEILDVGCGSGYFTRHVAQALPAAAVVGLDLDPSRVAFAESQRDASNLQYETGDMTNMPFADGRFDLVFSRFALVHCPAPSRPMREMARVTRPGGRVVVYDMVHDGIWFVPDRPAFAQVLETVIGIMREHGAEPNQGLFLGPGMGRAGLTSIEVQVIAHHALAHEKLYGACRDNWVATLVHLGQKLGSQLDERLVRSAVEELERVEGDELLVETTVLASGRKP